MPAQPHDDLELLAPSSLSLVYPQRHTLKRGRNSAACPWIIMMDVQNRRMTTRGDRIETVGDAHASAISWNKRMSFEFSQMDFRCSAVTRAKAVLNIMRALPRLSKASVLFVSWFAVLASSESRFSSVFFLSLGLSSAQSGLMYVNVTDAVIESLLITGIVLAVRPFVALLAVPLWSQCVFRIPCGMCGQIHLQAPMQIRAAREIL